MIKRPATLEGSLSQQKKSCSIETRTKRLLETSGLQSLSEQPGAVELVEKTFTKVLAEMGTPSSASLSTSGEGAGSSSPPCEGGSSSISAALVSSPSSAARQESTSKSRTVGLPKSEASSPTMHQLGKRASPTMVKRDVVAAVEPFGKTKSVLLFKPKREASLCLEREEDADKLRSVTTLDVKGMSITVTEKEGVSEQPLLAAAEEQNSAASGSSSTETNKSGSAGRMVLLPIKTLLSKHKKNKNTATACLVTKAKMLVFKAKNISTKQKSVCAVKTGSEARRGVVRSAAVKRVASAPSGLKRSGSPGKSFEAVKSVVVKKERSRSTPFKKTTSPGKSLKAGKGAVKPVVAKSEAPKPSGFKTTTSPGNGRPNWDLKQKAAAKKPEISTKETVVATKVRDQAGNQSSLTAAEPSCTQLAPETNLLVCKSVSTSPKTEVIDAEVDEKKGRLKGTAASSEEKEGKASETKSLQIKSNESLKPGSEEEATAAPGPSETFMDIKTGIKDEVEVIKSRDTSTFDVKPPAGVANVDYTAEEAFKESELESMKVESFDVASETLVKAEVSEESPAPGPGTKTMQSVSGAETNTNSEDAVTASGSQEDPASTTSPELTPGERMGRFLAQQSFDCMSRGAALSTGRFSHHSTLLLITNLPWQGASGGYTEADVATVLCRYGFIYTYDNIYVVPQGCMALALMPTMQTVQDILAASLHERLVVKHRMLHLHVVTTDISMAPFGFYRSLMRLTPYPSSDDGASTVYIQDISPMDTRDLRNTLRKIGDVTNFLPLLNKVFIEFRTVSDADRLGVWYSLLGRGRVHIVGRMKVPRGNLVAQPPRRPEQALPDSSDIIDGAKTPTAPCGVPGCSTPPFWVTMTTIPYVFPTASPWFNIPRFMTIGGNNGVTESELRGSAFPTIMLTGLPEGNYTHADVAKLVWQHLPQRTLHSLYYKVVVLPLQRRAFVFFCDRDLCYRFIRDHISVPVSVGGCQLGTHLVLEDMHPGSSEEMVYQSMLKWSNVYVPEIAALEDRLLCLEICEINVNHIMKVVKELAAVACFVNFLPLGNRICIEMVESSGVTQVMEHVATLEKPSVHPVCLKSLKQRLLESGDFVMDLEDDDAGAAVPGHNLPVTIPEQSHLQASQSRLRRRPSGP
ncbi:uncharacterized protein LOC133420425 [Cololabis saira]|uniref:uncharacterized protein LOC133420425 n=1 Tax=Cololabis saira TaxID=129043 RepID=UPI002AD29964|nr:uncharacterized protein LOC133420425 [Cololabis saira]